MKTLLIARHGNTFEKGQTPTRVGARTDLALSESGKIQSKKLGKWLKDNNYPIDIAYRSELTRTQETLSIALDEAGLTPPVTALPFLNEIDYGPDENQPEEKVIARLGRQAIDDWNNHAIVPVGWQFSPDEAATSWLNFASEFVDSDKKCALLVTSNGIARFAPIIIGPIEEFAKSHALKLSTGAHGIFKFDGRNWQVDDWNIRP